MEEEGTIVRPDNLKPAGKPMYRLYFKGLVRDEGTILLAGFGVAVCGDKDDLLFDKKLPIHNSAITLLEAKLIALKYGLTEVVSLGIKHISICCDNDQIFELVMERSKPQQENIALLMRDVQDIRKKLTSSIPILVTQNFAYKFAMEAICNEIIIDMPPARTETCTICLDEYLNADEMFSVDKCGHEFCSECVKRHIEVRLVEGSLVRCLHYRCTSMLTYASCVNILTPKLKEMWEQRIKEDSIPVTSRVYCQNPRCSALMSETELSISTGIRRSCVKCGEPFCINCKAPWHDNMSCDRYKTLHPNLTANDRMLRDLANQNRWRQCRKCQRMIERYDGCFSLLDNNGRCGHVFYYLCGADAGLCYLSHAPPPRSVQRPWQRPPRPITRTPSPSCVSCCFLLGDNCYMCCYANIDLKTQVKFL